MLSNYIKSENCHVCQFCCRFRNSNLWDVPLFTDEEKLELEKKYSDIIFERVNGLWTPRLISENEFFNCPFLNHEIGCILGKEKPFDCTIWPFYVMDKNGKIVLAKCNDCETINKIDKDSLIFLLQTYLLQIKEYIDKYPDYIKNYIPDYEIFFYL